MAFEFKAVDLGNVLQAFGFATGNPQQVAVGQALAQPAPLPGAPIQFPAGAAQITIAPTPTTPLVPAAVAGVSTALLVGLAVLAFFVLRR